MKTIGQRIRARREALKMTQRELSAATGYSHGIVSQWENDLSKPKNTLLVAKALRTNMEWLLTGEGSEDDLSVTVFCAPAPTLFPQDGFPLPHLATSLTCQI